MASRESIEDFLREVDEDLLIYDGELQSNDRRVEIHIWAGKLQSLTPETHTFDVFCFVCQCVHG